MNEAIWGFIGAVIGGICALLGTYITLRYSTKIELGKLTLSFLVEKKSIIEKLIGDYFYKVTGDIRQDELNIIKQYEIIRGFIELKSHFFIDSDEFHNLHYNFVCIDNDDSKNQLDILYEKREFNNNFNRFVKKELHNTVKGIFKMKNKI